MDEIKACPFCGGTVRIIVCDDEGNHKPPEYENNPWSGLGFLLYHSEEENPDCPIAHEAENQCGRTIYDSREEAAKAWNIRKIESKLHAHAVINWLGDCRCSNCGKSIDSTSNYCSWCGARLDEPEQKED